MSIVAVEVSLPSDSFEIGSILQDHEDVRIDLTQFVPIGESFIPYFWAETTDHAAFEEAVRNDGRVATLTAIDSAEDRTLYKIEWASDIDGFLATVVDHDLLVEDARGTDDRWWFRLRGPNRQNLAAFQRTLLEKDIQIHVHRIWNPDPSGDTYGLTDVQRETVQLAYRGGYFEDPRRVSQADLAEMLGISRQSVSRRLRGGLENLLAVTLMSAEILGGAMDHE